MAGFDAGNVVAPLDWDFTAFGGGRGRVPEPTDGQIRAFRRALLDLARTLAPGADVATAHDAVQTVAAADADALERVEDQWEAAVVDLCQGSPSREDLARLPARVKAAFFGWVTGELVTDPTGSTPGMRRSPAAGTNGASGS